MTSKIKSEIEELEKEIKNKDPCVHHDGNNCLNKYCPCYVEGKIKGLESGYKIANDEEIEFLRFLNKSLWKGTTSSFVLITERIKQLEKGYEK